MSPFQNVHPDDILFFREIAEAMRSVAKQYGLPLRSVTGHPEPEYRTSPLGDCSASGDIRLVLRGKMNGEWDVVPRDEDSVWQTAAHELAHLRFMNHGQQFQEFELEMRTAISNRRVDHKQKVIDRLVKLQKSREGEAALGNEQAAEAFAAAINRMLIEHELNPSDIDYARNADRDPVIELQVNWRQHMRPGDDPKRFEPAKRRIAWQETLARVVSKAHLCSFLISTTSDTIWFVGTKSHATVAEYVYSTLVYSAYDMAKAETQAYRKAKRREGITVRDAAGFHESWLASFIQRIDERLEASRKDAVKAATADVPGGESMALIRLSGALQKVNDYLDDKFGRKRKYAPRLYGPRGYHEAGNAAGRAAADKIALGRRGVADSVARKLLS